MLGMSNDEPANYESYRSQANTKPPSVATPAAAPKKLAPTECLRSTYTWW
jgi:hypothetical protein